MRGWPWLCTLLILSGCAKQTALPVVTVSGTIQLNGQPLANADVTFLPTDRALGPPSSARTDSNGQFSLKNVRGQPQVPEGSYKVRISQRVLPDGTPVPQNDKTPPIESPARELLPQRYSDLDQTELTANVGPTSKAFEFKLEAAQ
jgi:hypothetical protein